MLDRVAAELFALTRGEERVDRCRSAFDDPRREHSGRGGGEGRDAVFASFAVTADVSAGAEVNVTAGEPNKFGDAKSGLHADDEQGVVASAGPGAGVRRGEKRIGFGFGEERDESPVEPFRWDRENPLDGGGMLGMSERRVAEQRLDGGETLVAGPDGVVTLRFEVIEKASDDRRVEVADVETRRWSPCAVGGVVEQQTPGVAVRGDGLRAGVAFPDEPVGEERLQGRRERGHDRAWWCSRRSAAAAMSSGAALRYQYVAFGSTWPRNVDSNARRAPMSAPVQ